MNYEDVCKYVFSMEIVDWELRSYVSRKRELVQARQISIYLGDWFWPKMTDRELTEIFGQDHCMAHHSLKSVKALLFSDKEYRAKMDRYLRDISKKIKESQSKEVKRAVEDEIVKKKIMESIKEMEIIARVYCDLTGMTLTKK